MAEKETRIMKKPIIILAAALVLAGGSMGAFLAVKNKKDAETSQAEAMKKDNVLFSFNEGDINKMEFDLADGDYIIEKTGDDSWELTSEKDFILDQTYLQLVRTYLSALTAETSYGRADDSKKAMYGLNDPTVIKLSSDSQTYELMIGDKSPTGDYYYVMTSEKPNVYAIDSYKGTSLVPERLVLRSRELTLYKNNEIESITISNKNCEKFNLLFNKNDQTWGLDKKYDLIGADKTAISSMVANLIRTEANELIAENFTDLKSFGLDDPDSEITIKGTDGKNHSFLVKSSEDESSLSYVLNKDNNLLALYSNSEISFAESTVYDYTPKEITGSDIFSISGFDIKEGVHSDEFIVDINERTCKINGKDVDISGSEGYLLFQNYYNSFSKLPTTGVDIDAKPELEDPVVSVVYHLKEGEDTTLDVTDGGDGKFYIFRDGKYTGAYADDSRYTGRASIEEYYLKLIAYSLKK